ncbi:MAG TPA: hypothetical protein VGU74_12170 [Gemmatimonadales bacterium]|nr:hypothetical protein [Gemmatimonadales bacterium]
MTARWWMPVALAGLAACAASPEASRTRSGGPGADPGNHAAVVQIHAGNKIYYKTPCRTPKVKCSGPVQDAGT